MQTFNKHTSVIWNIIFLKKITSIVHPYMYFVAKVEIQTQSRNVHAKNSRARALQVYKTIPSNLVI
jgi:hypothetical protein